MNGWFGVVGAVGVAVAMIVSSAGAQSYLDPKTEKPIIELFRE